MTDLRGKWAVCSKGRIGKVEDFKTLPWGESWVGTGLDGTPWASRAPLPIKDADAQILEQVHERTQIRRRRDGDGI